MRALTPEDFQKSSSYVLLRFLDSHGSKWLAQSGDGAYRAIRILERAHFEHPHSYDAERKRVRDYAPISRTHENLVPVLEFIDNDEAEYSYYVVELADDLKTGRQINPASYHPRTLRSSMASLPALDVAGCLNICLALTSAVGHLHEHGLIHDSISPAKIPFINARPKLGGIAISRETRSFHGGVFGYVSPEESLTPQADVYSLGKVIYELMTGQDRNAFPILPENWAERVGKASSLLKWNKIILKACDHNPRKRYPTARELQDELLELQ